MGIRVGIHTTNNAPYHQHDRPFHSLRANRVACATVTGNGNQPSWLDQLNRRVAS